jgi:hypothetical protein
MILVCWLIFLWTGFLQPYRDAQINIVLADNLLAGRGWSLVWSSLPDSFAWSLKVADRSQVVRVTALDQEVQSLIDQGDLVRGDPDYLLQPTRWPGEYASTFLPGPAVMVVPLLALAEGLFPDPSLRGLVHALVAKVASATAACVSAWILWEILRRRYSESAATKVTWCYALATGVWTVSSQLWMSHSPNILLLLAGIDAYERSERDPRWSYAVGLWWGLAVWCRATSALMIMALGTWWLVTSRPRLARMVIAGFPFACLLAWHNHYLFGDMFYFGELRQSGSIEQIRGGGGIFQTPILEGLAGLLVSPSRGLLVYSPILAVGVIGWGWSLLHRREVWLAPLLLGSAAIWIVQSVHFDWWGGWTYGYRPVVDTVPVFCLGLGSVVDSWETSQPRRWLWRILLGWSFATHLLGAVFYDLIGWNAREVWEVTMEDGRVARWEPWGENPREAGPKVRALRLDIDQPAYRDRLWSWLDSPLVYYATHPMSSLTTRWKLSYFTSFPERFRRAETLASLAEGYRVLGRPGKATPLLRQSVELDPGNIERRGQLESLEIRPRRETPR